METKRWEETTASAAQSARTCIDPGFNLIGGGARVSGTDAHNVLTASYPEGNCWLAQTKAGHATLTVWAIGLLDRRDEWEVQVNEQRAVSLTVPKATVSLETGYALTGGGGRLVPVSRGLAASYPASANSWEVIGEEQVSALGSAISYIISIRPRAGGSVPSGLTRASGPAAQPVIVVVLDGYTLTGGGAVAGGANVLRSSFPEGDKWSASSNHQDAGSLVRTAVYAIGIKPPAPPPVSGP